MKNKTKILVCGIDHFNVLRKAKKNSVLLVQKALIVGASLTEQHYPVMIRKDRFTVLEIEADSLSFDDH